MFKDRFIKRIAQNASIILVGNLSSSVINLISFTIVANQLGPEFLAVLVLAQTYSLILNDIFNIQTWESMIKFGTLKLSKSEIGSVVKTNMALDLISAVVAYVFAVLLLRAVADFLGWDNSYLDAISIYALTILFNITSLTIGIPRLFDKFMVIAKIYVVMSFLKLACVLYAFYTSGSLYAYIYIYLTFEILTNISLISFSLILINRELMKGWWKTSININVDQIRFIWWSNLRTIIRIPVRHLDMLIVASVISMKVLGIYKVYKEIAGLISRIGEPVNQAIYPEFARLLGANRIDKTSNVAKQTVLMLGAIGGILVISLLAVSSYLVGTFFGTEYLSHINVLYLMLLLYGLSFVTVPVNSLFIASGFVKLSVNIVLVSNSMYLVFAYFLGQTMGIYGIIIAYAIQVILNKGMKIFFLAKYSDKWGMAVR